MHFQTFYLKYTFFESYFSGLGGLWPPTYVDTLVIKCTQSVRLNEKSPSEAFGLQLGSLLTLDKSEEFELFSGICLLGKCSQTPKKGHP